MDEELKKEILSRFEKLPNDIKRVILSSDFPRKISAIREKHLLTPEQEVDLSDEATFVMIGLERPGAFVENVRKELSIPYEKASAIALEVNETVFKEIRESLKQIHTREPEAPTESALNKREFGLPPPPTKISFTPPPSTPPATAPMPKPADEAPGNLPTGEKSSAWERYGARAGQSLFNSPTPVSPQKPSAVTRAASPPAPVPGARGFAFAPPPRKQTSDTAPIEPPVVSAGGSLPRPISSISPTENAGIPPWPPLPPAPPAEQKSAPREEGIVGQKLSSTTTSLRDEKRYVMDPYREPTE